MRGFCLVGILLLLPTPAGAQDQPSVAPPRFALTGGVGVSYGGVGLLGEAYLGKLPVSLTLGGGGVPGWDLSGVSFGLRAYAGSGSSRLYIEGMGAYLWSPSEGDTDFYGPAILGGYAYVGHSGVTFNAAVGAGRQANGGAGVALNLGVGFTWR